LAFLERHFAALGGLLGRLGFLRPAWRPFAQRWPFSRLGSFNLAFAARILGRLGGFGCRRFARPALGGSGSSAIDVIRILLSWR